MDIAAATEDALASAMLRELIEAFPMAIALLDESGSVLVVNSRFDRTYGAEVLTSEPLRTLLCRPESEWRAVQLRCRAGTDNEVGVRVFRFHGSSILIVNDTDDPAYARKVCELRERISDLERSASTDVLTRVWNRAHLDRVTTLEIDRSLRLRQPLSLILIDVDHFKTINDTRGHLAGDRVLYELARVIEKTMRSADILFRWGGEEFVVLATATGYRGAAKLAAKIRREVEQHQFAEAGAVTISLGVAEHVASESSGTWFDRADAALYRAKSDGRNRVHVDERGSSDSWAADTGGSVIRLVWQEAYECGEPTIDAEHRELFELANALLDAKDSSEEFRQALRTLLVHIARHFEDEEALLTLYGYKHLEAHKRAHARLLERAGELSILAEQGKATLGTLVEFVANTVVAQHLFKADRDYFPLFKGEPDSTRTAG